MQKSKGFTIIELLVVIAVIAVLAAIVMLNITGFISKGKDTGVKSNLSTMLGYAVSYYSSNGFKFDNVISSADYLATKTTIEKDYVLNISCENSATCATGTNNQKWCAGVTLLSEPKNKYCVDSSGKKSESATASCALGVCAN